MSVSGRFVIPLAVALAIVLGGASSVAADHAEPVPHFTLQVKDLAPGESQTLHATYDRGILKEGWVFIMVGTVLSNATPLQVTLSLNGTEVASYEWQPDGQVHLESLALPETAEVYDVTFTNPGDEPLKYVFYFDQSCDCFGKPVLHLRAPWWYVFNFDFYKGETVWFHMEKPEAVNVQFTVVQRNGTGGTYPQDFTEVLKYPRDALPNGTVRWDVLEDETYYVFAQATGNPEEAGNMLVPRIFISHETSLSENGDKATPGPGAVVTLGVLAALGVAFRARSRSRAR